MEKLIRVVYSSILDDVGACGHCVEGPIQDVGISDHPDCPANDRCKLE